MEQIFAGILQVVVSMVLAAAIGLALFVDKWQKGEKFQKEKLIKTILLGAAIGLVACLSNFLLASGNYLAYLGVTTAVIAVGNPLVKAGWRHFKAKFMDNGGGGFPV